MKKLMLILIPFLSLSGYSQGLNDSLCVYFPFTGNAFDSTGHGNNGMVNGAVLTTDRFGNSNSAYYFDGDSDEIRIAGAFNGKQPFTTNASVCYWIKTKTNKTAAAILTFHSACTNNNNDFLTFYINNAAGSHYLYNTVYWHSPVLSVDESEVTDSIWHLVCYTYDNDTATLYLDGINVQKSAVTPESGFYFDTNTDLVIGNISSNSCGYDFYFEGSIDDIRVYNRTISQSEVSILNSNRLNIESTAAYNHPVLYPNPGRNSITISDLSTDITSIIITDLSGKMIMNHVVHSGGIETIDLSAYSNGSYQVQFMNRNNRMVYSEKIIIAK